MSKKRINVKSAQCSASPVFVAATTATGLDVLNEKTRGPRTLQEPIKENVIKNSLAKQSW